MLFQLTISFWCNWSGFQTSRQCFQNLGYQLHLQQVKVYHYSPCTRQELLKLSCNQWQNSQIIATVHYFHNNYHHHCYYHHLHYHRKMHLYRLRILLIIHLDCNMICCLFHLHFVCFLQKYIFLQRYSKLFVFYSHSKRTQISFTTIIHIFIVLFILICTYNIYISLILIYIHLFILIYT